MTACVAAMPEAKAAAWPPSSSPSARSSAVRVGLAAREYSYFSTKSPTPACAYVDVWWIAGMTER